MDVKDSSELFLGSPRKLQTLSADSQTQDTTPHANQNIHPKWSPRGGKDLKDLKELVDTQKSAEERGEGEGGIKEEEGGGRGDGGGGGGGEGGGGEAIGNDLEKTDLVTRAGEKGGEGSGGEREQTARDNEMSEEQPFQTEHLKRDDNANYLGLNSNANTTETDALLPLLSPNHQQKNEDDHLHDLVSVSQEERYEHGKGDTVRQDHSERIRERNSRENDIEQMQDQQTAQEPKEHKQETYGEYSKHPENIPTSNKDEKEYTPRSEQKEQPNYPLGRDTDTENTYMTKEIRKTEVESDKLESTLNEENTTKQHSNLCEEERKIEGQETKEETILGRDDALDDYKTVSSLRIVHYPQDEEETMAMLSNNNYSDTMLQLDEENLREILLGNHGDGKVELGVKSLSTATLNTQNGSSGSEGESRFQCSFPHAGILLAIASSFCFSLGSALVKILHQMDPMELVVFRFLLMWIFNLPLLVHSRQHPLPKGRRLTLVARGIAGSVAVMCHFYAFRHMPIADAGTITFTSPIVVLLLSWMFLKEPCDVLNVVLVMVTLSGIICIAKPAFIFGDVQGAEKSEQELWGLIACLGGVVGQACVYTILRLLKDVHYVVVLNMFCIVAIIMTTCVAFASGGVSVPSLRQVGFILILGFLSFAEQVFLTKASQVEQASTVSIARMSSVLFGFLLQIILFGLYPDAFSIGGALMVSSCVILLGVKTWWQSRKEAKKVEKK